jgi:hypothetical protein
LLTKREPVELSPAELVTPSPKVCASDFAPIKMKATANAAAIRSLENNFMQKI